MPLHPEKHIVNNGDGAWRALRCAERDVAVAAFVRAVDNLRRNNFSLIN